MRTNFIKHILFSAIALFSMSVVAQDTLSSPELVKRLYDIEYLATVPEKGEQSGNFSSYDRRSKYDTSTQTYVQWGANGDGTGFIRKEEDGIVVFEKEGPWCYLVFLECLSQRRAHQNIH